MANQLNVLLTICGMILKTHINKFFEENTLNDILFKEVRNKSEELKQ